ncbi:MAG: tetratricopeptide repeat protein [Candidatus Caenarcaniphilales bacterium]|nr:tetratricopeptide repeat protein [Candidatus Caenarcaniphilales bacterium]
MIRCNKFALCCLGLAVLTFPQAVTSQGQSPSMIQNKYSPSPVAKSWANRGVELANQGDFQAAVEAFYEAWKLNPEDTNRFAESLSTSYNNYGKQMAERKNYDRAITLMRRAVFFMERNKIAAQNLDKLLEIKGLDPNNYGVRIKEARKLRQEGYVDESVAEYLKAVSLSKQGSQEYLKAKLELAQIYQVIYLKYSKTPVGRTRLQKMLVLANELAKSNSKDSRPHILIGRAYIAAQKLPEAIDAFEKALAKNPNNLEAQEGLIGAWTKVVAIAPKEVDNLLGLSSALMRAGQSEQAKAYLQKAKAIDPNNKDVDDLIANFQKTEKELEVYKIAERALKAQKSGNLDQAIDLYQLAIKSLPPTPEASNVYFNLGIAYQSKGNDEKAITSYKQALKYNPANQDAKSAIEQINKKIVLKRAALSEKAVKLQSQGKITEAVTLYKQLIQEKPNDAQSHFNLGTAYQEQKRYALALQQYQKASKLDPSSSEFRNTVQQMKKAMNSGVFQSAQATEVLKEAVSLQQEGRINQAIGKYQQAIALDSKNPQSYFNLATALHSVNNIPNAINNYKKAYQLDPANYPEANFFVATLLETQEKYPDALNYYKRYLEDQPNSQYSEEARERMTMLGE